MRRYIIGGWSYSPSPESLRRDKWNNDNAVHNCSYADYADARMPGGMNVNEVTMFTSTTVVCCTLLYY
ncbi:hypothetical protein QOZ22_30050, partial [Pseudomonas aeruginosa]|uniref:hypothetical protein n=1 Tax=Pseudomonas aeruginosa TaxID=287 RepID=UPI0034598FA6